VHLLDCRNEQHSRVIRSKTLLVGLDGPVKGEEILIPAEGRCKDRVALGIALAANFLGFRICLCNENRNVAVRARANLLSALIAEGTKLRSLALAFGLHPLIDCLAVLFWQIGTADPQVHDRNAQAGRLAIDLLAHPSSQLRALIAYHLDETRFAEHATQRRDDQGR
jgi:hypothetical protein